MISGFSTLSVLMGDSQTASAFEDNGTIQCQTNKDIDSHSLSFSLCFGCTCDSGFVILILEIASIVLSTTESMCSSNEQHCDCFQHCLENLNIIASTQRKIPIVFVFETRSAPTCSTECQPPLKRLHLFWHQSSTTFRPVIVISAWAYQ